MPTGAITSEIDVAQIVFYAFVIFFIGLIVYLRREDRREGYPLEPERADRGASGKAGAFPSPASPKTFNLASGETVTIPTAKPEAVEIAAVPASQYPGAPLVPTGDPMLDAVGPASYAARADVPDHTYEGEAKIVPLRVATDFSVDPRDPNPVGMSVVGADGQVAGTVADVWVDRAEHLARYFEIDVAPSNDAGGDGGAMGSRRVLVPVPLLSKINRRRGQIRVDSVMSRHFSSAPVLKNPDQVTLLEEDRISAYFASGHLYATSSRQEPLF